MQGGTARLSCALAHHGEEPPLSGTGGAGTVFFSGCTMACLFCQNHQISRGGIGDDCSSAALAGHFLRLQGEGCHNIELVSPTPHIPFILEAVERASQGGLSIPIVYNTNSYLTPEALSILEGIVDVYLPDLKYADDSYSSEFSSTPGYVTAARKAIKTMARQVHAMPPELSPRTGTALKGIIVRLLLLPGGQEGAEDTLAFLAHTFPASLPVSIMSQYAPLYKACSHPSLNSPVPGRRREEVIKKALELGLTNLWVQDDGAHAAFIPDFTMKTPFIS